MVEKISEKIADKIISINCISEKMREWYIYSFIRIIETSICMMTIILIGLISGKLFYLMIFWCFFISLRKRTGGFHCNKFWQCYICTVLVFVGMIILEPFLILIKNVLECILLLSSISVLIMGCINHPNINMNAKELKSNKRMARYILFIELVIIISSKVINIDDSYYISMVSSIILCSALMIAGKLFKQEVKINDAKENFGESIT